MVSIMPFSMHSRLKPHKSHKARGIPGVAQREGGDGKSVGGRCGVRCCTVSCEVHVVSKRCVMVRCVTDPLTTPTGSRGLRRRVCRFREGEQLLLICMRA